MLAKWRDSLWWLGVMGFLLLLAGCAQMEYAPKGPYLYYHKELPAADRAVEAARAAGKDRECPEEFKAAEKMRDDAYQTYWACRTKEAQAMANEATAQVGALCPKRAVAPPPPPPPPLPTAALTASPATIPQGQCTTLSWTTTNTTSASIDQGIGSVAPSGSQRVCPPSTTRYSLTGTGAGGSQSAATTVEVLPPPPPPAPAAPPPPPRLTLHIHFDTDKATIRQADIPELQKAVEFVKQYPGRKISIEGHTDNVGDAKYNQGLSERRAAAVKEYLLKNGVGAGERITTVGYGLTKPVATNATPSGRFENRRVELVVLPD